MVIDSSPLVAILEREAGFEELLDAIEEAPDRYVSAVCLYETAVRLYGKEQDRRVLEDLSDLVNALDIAVIEFDRDSIEEAVLAYAQYGKGIHPARLNLVDCIAYALAQRLGESLLFKGNDFSRTNVVSAI